MIAYKLMKLRKNGTLGSLFINAKAVIPTGKWLRAKGYPTKGFSYRKGWHCTFQPKAPHLTMKGRVWTKVEMKDYTPYVRPESQGDLWFTAQSMKIIEVISNV